MLKLTLLGQDKMAFCDYVHKYYSGIGCTLHTLLLKIPYPNTSFSRTKYSFLLPFIQLTDTTAGRIPYPHFHESFYLERILRYLGPDRYKGVDKITRTHGHVRHIYLRGVTIK